MAVINYLKSGGVNFTETDELLDELEDAVGDYAEHYDIAFISGSPFTLSVYDNIKHWDGTIETSVDRETWTVWTGTSAVNSSSDGKLYLRGFNNTRITGTNINSVRWVFTGTDIYGSGNIENLLDYNTVKNGNHPSVGAYCFSCLFYNNAELITSPDILCPFLERQACYNMFYSCTKLIEAPRIEATSANNQAMLQMFAMCTSLVKCSAIHLSTMSIECCNGMYFGCTSLVTLPAIPATSFYNMACYNMFASCTRIKISTTQTAECNKEYRIPISGTGTVESGQPCNYMFVNTGNTFNTGNTPSLNTTYYTNCEIIY